MPPASSARQHPLGMPSWSSRGERQPCQGSWRWVPPGVGSEGELAAGTPGWVGMQCCMWSKDGSTALPQVGMRRAAGGALVLCPPRLWWGPQLYLGLKKGVTQRLGPCNRRVTVFWRPEALPPSRAICCSNAEQSGGRISKPWVTAAQPTCSHTPSPIPCPHHSIYSLLDTRQGGRGEGGGARTAEISIPASPPGVPAGRPLQAALPRAVT